MTEHQEEIFRFVKTPRWKRLRELERDDHAATRELFGGTDRIALGYYLDAKRRAEAAKWRERPDPLAAQIAERQAANDPALERIGVLDTAEATAQAEARSGVRSGGRAVVEPRPAQRAGRRQPPSRPGRRRRRRPDREGRRRSPVRRDGPRRGSRTSRGRRRPPWHHVPHRWRPRAVAGRTDVAQTLADQASRLASERLDHDRAEFWRRRTEGETP